MKINEAKDILNQLGLPKNRQNDMCARVLLALAKIKEGDSWKNVTDEYSRIHDIIQFIANHYDFSYAENTRETIRKDALKPFRNTAIVEDNGKPTNSPNYAYRLTIEMIELIKTYKTAFWQGELDTFLSAHIELKEIYSHKRTVKQIPIIINGKPATLSLGIHNKLQKAIIEGFASRFAQGSDILYIGDTRDRFLYRDDKKLKELGIAVLEGWTLPDIILYCKEKNWVYFIEAVTSGGTMSPARVSDIAKSCDKCNSSIIYVTAFLHFATYRKFIYDLAWETEVWIAEQPNHMIHLNGDRFIGPRKE